MSERKYVACLMLAFICGMILANIAALLGELIAGLRI